MYWWGKSFYDWCWKCIPELKGLSETCNRIYKLQDVDVLFQCLLMDQMDWEEEKLHVQFSTIYMLESK